MNFCKLFLVFIDAFDKCVVDFGIYFFLNTVAYSGTFLDDCLIGLLIDLQYLSTAVFNSPDSVSYPVIGCLTRIFCSCSSCLLQNALILFRHTFEELIVHYQRYQVRQMVGLDHVILLLIEPVRYDYFVRIFLGIYRMLLKADVYFGKAHRSRICSYGFPKRQMERILHGTYLLPFEVTNSLNRFIGAHDTEPLIGDSEQLISAFFIDAAYQAAEFLIIEDFPDYLERRIKKLHNLHVFLNTEATPEFIRTLNPDIIVNSTGSLPLILPIPGLKENVGKGKVQTVLGVIDNLDNYPEDCTGKKVVVIGAGAVGLDVVEFFAPRGADTTVIEMLPYIVGPALDPITKVSIVDLMNKYNVHQRPSTALQEVKPDCFVVKNPDGSMEEVEFDYGCICMGLKSNNPVLDMLKEEFADVELMNIGDSKRQRRIIEGTEEGRAIVKVLERNGFFN